MSLRLEYPGSAAGVVETIDALLLVCPDPAVRGEVNILVGTNTSVVKRLIEACKEKMGNDFLYTLTVHPDIKDAYEQVIAGADVKVDNSQGSVWFPGFKPVKI